MKPLQRSYLFVPGDRPERFPKALAAGADVVILDLEDAVAPQNKIAARHAVADFLSAGQPVTVRINSIDTVWWEDDARLCRQPGVSGLMLPKASSAAEIAEVAARLAKAGDDSPLILPLIETASGMANALVMAQAARVFRLVFGSIDFQLDMDILGDDDALLTFRSQLVLASRLANIAAPCDGVTTALDDPELLIADASRSRRLGFGAKLCIHPKQVETVNRCFRPDAADIEWARRVTDAAASGAAVTVDGKMVDKPVLARARRILQAAGSLQS